MDIFSAVAELERSLMLERQREGIAKAKADRKHKAKAPTARAKSAEVAKMKAEGKTVPEITSALEISRASVFRILKDLDNSTLLASQ